MSHPDRESLRRFIDGELTDDDRLATAAHIDKCTECSDTLANVQREDAWVGSLLSTLDSPQRIAASRFAPRTRMPIWLRRAAVLFFLLSVAGAAWALPGSPLRRWLDDTAVDASNASTLDETANHAPAPHGGIEIPVDGAVQIAFMQRQSRGAIRVILSDSTGIVLTILGDDAGIDSRSEHSVVIDNRASSADYAIRVPHGAADLVIRVADRIVFRKTADQVVTAVAPSDGIYTIALDRETS